MDWKALLTDLIDSGLTQEEIATRCGVAQSTVSDLGRGLTRKPNFEFGTKLVELHKRCKKAAVKSDPAKV